LNSGISKLLADKETYDRLHGFASGAYPVLGKVPPGKFGKALGAAEVALGGMLLAPMVIGDGLAGFVLSAFSGGLLRLYMKTPGLRQEGSVRPTRDGTAIAKDLWLAGIGLTLMSSSVGSRWTARKVKKRRGHHMDAATGR
jgi:hypothetical protein